MDSAIQMGQATRVGWFSVGNGYQRGHGRDFGSVLNAVRFVMELPNGVRETASLFISEGIVPFGDIETLYAELVTPSTKPMKEKAPT